MAEVTATERLNDFGLVGKLGKATEYGEKIFGQGYYGEEEITGLAGTWLETSKWGIYQRRHKLGKVVYAKLKFYTPTNPRTASQTTQRNKFTAGMTAWANLTNEQKTIYNERAKARHLHGVNLYLREYLKSN